MIGVPRRHLHPNLFQPARQIQLCSPPALTSDNRLIQAFGQVNPEEKARDTSDISFIQFASSETATGALENTYPPCA
jgi:hypothetical protein